MSASELSTQLLTVLEQTQEPVNYFYPRTRLAAIPIFISTMQLHNAADGQEHEMSIVSYPMWSPSPSHVCGDPSSSADANGTYNHWWPSQAYHCTFCPRVYRTAQALGGHMNIHRRERAFANDMGTHFHTRRGSPTNCATTTLSRSSSLPAGQRSSFFRGSHQLLMNHTPPNSLAPSMENCYANRTIAPAPDYTGSTHLVTANCAPIPPDMTYRNRVDGTNLEAAKLQDSGHANNNISDPLSWLFSQLPPPGSVTNLQRQQQQQQQQSRGSSGSNNVLMQKNLAKPYHRALAVRRNVGRHSEQNPQPRGISEARGSSYGKQGDGEERLDLELRL